MILQSAHMTFKHKTVPTTGGSDLITVEGLARVLGQPVGEVDNVVFHCLKEGKTPEGAAAPLNRHFGEMNLFIAVYEPTLAGDSSGGVTHIQFDYQRMRERSVGVEHKAGGAVREAGHA